MVNGNLLQPFRGDLRFFYRCPACNGEFYLDHHTLQINEDIYETTCCFCEEELSLRVLLNATCSTKWKTSITRKIEKAVSVLTAQGYSKRDAKSLVNSVVDTDSSVEEIIRQAIESENIAETIPNDEIIETEDI